MKFTPQTENLYRGCAAGALLRTPTRDSGEGEGDIGGAGDVTAGTGILYGHFAVFNEWIEIDSWYEGQFLERLMPGAFTNTINQHRDRIKTQFDHGCDDYIGGALVGAIDVLQEDEIGAYYELSMYDTDYNRDRVLPLAQGRTMAGDMRGSALGASFRFRIVKDEWNTEPGISVWNPKGLPERTITQVTVFEFGPVVWPAYPSATAMAGAGMRSLSDHFLDRLRSRRSPHPAEVAPAHSDPPTIQSPPALDGPQRSASRAAFRARAYQAHGRA